MPGILVPLMEQRHLDFSYLAGSAQEVLTLHTALPVVPYKTGLLMVRVHTNDIPSGGSILLRLYPTLPSQTDGRQFTNTALAVGEITVDDGDSAPIYLHTALSSISAAYLLVQVHATQATSTQKFAAQLSADLMLRED